MDLSVIICTYNRSYHLRNVMQSLSEQVVPENLKWEIIVVDNNSTDNTFDVVKEFGTYSNIPIKYVKEQKQGLSHARNMGIMESDGKYVAYTDDDAIADRNWVAVLYEAFQKYKCDGVGGRIYLKPVKKLPHWLNKELWGFLGYLNYGDQPRYLNKKHPPFGGNMAFLKDVFEKIGYFNPDFGRNGNNNYGSEEDELFLRFSKAGGNAFYIPNAVVHHVIGHEKIKKKYFRMLHFKAGEQNALLDDSRYKRSIFGIPLFLIPQFLRSIVNYVKKPTIRKQMNIWWYIGFMKGRIIKTKL